MSTSFMEFIRKLKSKHNVICPEKDEKEMIKGIRILELCLNFVLLESTVISASLHPFVSGKWLTAKGQPTLTYSDMRPIFVIPHNSCGWILCLPASLKAQDALICFNSFTVNKCPSYCSCFKKIISLIIWCIFSLTVRCPDLDRLSVAFGVSFTSPR